MPFAAHRHGDLRACSGTTVVIGQSTVFVNNRLWAVQGDIVNHGGGGLIPTGQTVNINNKLVICHTPDAANPDDLCPLPPIHCTPFTAQGSSDTFAY
jgi:hypothetical protein